MFKKVLFLISVISINFTLTQAYKEEDFATVEWGADVTVFENLDLSKAPFSNFDFFKKHFINTNLVDACLQKCSSARFINCNIINGGFKEAELEKTGFYDCDLTNADFSDSNCKGVFFIDCILNKASFVKADLSLALFVNCDLTGACFNDSIYNDAQFDEKSRKLFRK